jgi:hypothetical protein
LPSAPVEFDEDASALRDKKEKRKKGTIVFQSTEVFRDASSAAKSSVEQQVLAEKMKAVAQILDA